MSATPGVVVLADLDAFCERAFEPLGRTVPAPLRPDLRLVDDLGFDSLELYQFQVVVEELCGHELPDELLAQLDTLGAAHVVEAIGYRSLDRMLWMR